MRVLEINSTCGGGSTGGIVCQIADEYLERGDEVKIAYGRYLIFTDKVYDTYKIGNRMDLYWHVLVSRLFDAHGFASKKATMKFIKWANVYNPDVLWIHNIHGYYINIDLLFGWIKSRPEMNVYWLLHDCWSFTGHCSHFVMAKCQKWRIKCMNCPIKNDYPKSLIFDFSEKNFLKKKRLFCGINKMEIVTPSVWLKKLVMQSFLKDYPVRVRKNEINKNIFKPTPSEFKKKNGLEGKIIILGVSNAWTLSKGFKDFIELSQMLDDTYVIVLVGLSKRQKRNLPKNIFGIVRTTDAKELAAIYTAADYYVNMSRQETFGLTTLEAASCGTKVIVYKGTACEEVALDNGGIAVPFGVNNVYEAITGNR